MQEATIAQSPSMSTRKYGFKSLSRDSRPVSFELMLVNKKKSNFYGTAPGRRFHSLECYTSQQSIRVRIQLARAGYPFREQGRFTSLENKKRLGPARPAAEREGQLPHATPLRRGARPAGTAAPAGKCRAPAIARPRMARQRTVAPRRVGRSGPGSGSGARRRLQRRDAAPGRPFGVVGDQMRVGLRGVGLRVGLRVGSWRWLLDPALPAQL